MKKSALLLMSILVTQLAFSTEPGLNPAPGQRTSFQTGSPYRPELDLQTDQVLVVDDRGDKVAAWRENGYQVSVFQAIGRGAAADYVSGNWTDINGVRDGRDHSDDIQRDAQGSTLSHGSASTVYYMVPTLRHTEFMKSLVKNAIDAGSQGICMEEPEFWERAGYSPAFKQEWQSWYGEAWQNPASSPAQWYKSARLKHHLYHRTLDLVFQYAKEYSRSKGVDFQCIVPTHSLLNYSQWGIVSPMTSLVQMAGVDGIIGQVWTGTARSPVLYNGVKKERTFENAYLEYSSLKNMVRGTGKSLWVLADPIEDDPSYDWNDYKINYEKTVIASLLNPDITGFEIMPWPERVFLRPYPLQKVTIHAEEFLHVLDGLRARDAKTAEIIPEDSVRHWRAILGRNPHSLDSLRRRIKNFELGMEIFRFLNQKMDNLSPAEKTLIPADYAAELLTIGNLLAGMADLPAQAIRRDDSSSEVGVLVSDGLMFQHGGPWSNRIESIHQTALSMLKSGLAVEMVHLDRCDSLAYLAPYKILFLSYEAQKPMQPEHHRVLSRWIKRGGVLVLLGANDDPFAAMPSWWRKENAKSPAEHLLRLCGLAQVRSGRHAVGKGYVVVNTHSPQQLATLPEGSEKILEIFESACSLAKIKTQKRNHLTLYRGPWVIAAVMDESVSQAELRLQGRFIDVLAAGLPVIREKTIACNSHALLLDLDQIDAATPAVLLSSSRIREEKAGPASIQFVSRGPANSKGWTVVRLPRKPKSIAVSCDQAALPFQWRWDSENRLAYIALANQARPVRVSLYY